MEVPGGHLAGSGARVGCSSARCGSLQLRPALIQTAPVHRPSSPRCRLGRSSGAPGQWVIAANVQVLEHDQAVVLGQPVRFLFDESRLRRLARACRAAIARSCFPFSALPRLAVFRQLAVSRQAGARFSRSRSCSSFFRRRRSPCPHVPVVLVALGGGNSNGNTAVDADGCCQVGDQRPGGTALADSSKMTEMNTLPSGSSM